MQKILEAVSFGGAVLGAALLALNISISGFGYIPFLLSSISTILLLRKSNASKVIEWQTYIFVIINLVGIFRYLT